MSAGRGDAGVGRRRRLGAQRAPVAVRLPAGAVGVPAHLAGRVGTAVVVGGEPDRLPVGAVEVGDLLERRDERILGDLRAAGGGDLQCRDHQVAHVTRDQDVRVLTRLLRRGALDRLARERLVVVEAVLGLLAEATGQVAGPHARQRRHVDVLARGVVGGGDVGQVRRPVEVDVPRVVALVVGGRREVDDAGAADDRDHHVDAVGLELLGGDGVLLGADALTVGLHLGHDVDAAVRQHLLHRVDGGLGAGVPVDAHLLALEVALGQRPLGERGGDRRLVGLDREEVRPGLGVHVRRCLVAR